MPPVTPRKPRRPPPAAPVPELVRRLKRNYRDAKLALDFTTPLELLVALILAAQCTDKKVNEVTATLFRKYRSAADYAAAPLEELEQDVRQTGFFRQKARTVQTCCRQLVERFGGEVPARQDDLLQLQGVGRKTANILLGNAFGVPGIGVDTHVLRLAQRLGLSQQTDPDKVEADLTAVVPRRDQIQFCYLVQMHGRMACFARKPACPTCFLADICPYQDKTEAAPRRGPAFGRHPGPIR
jgi:endonuclease III